MNPPPSPVPRFSVVVATFRRPQRLAECLASIAAATPPRDPVEVVVVDDDNGAESLDDLLNVVRDRFPVRLIAQENSGTAIARNTGARLARGALLVFIDDDCTVTPGFFPALEAAADRNPEALIAGRTVNALTANAWSTASQELVVFLFDYYNEPDGPARFCTGSNLAVPRRAFADIGGFDPAFYRVGAEDREFCDRWLHLGHWTVYAPSVAVEHRHTLGFRSFVRQHERYGRGAHHYHLLRAERGLPAIPTEPPPFYMRMMAWPFRRQPLLRAARTAALFALSQAAHTKGCIAGTRATRRNRPV